MRCIAPQIIDLIYITLQMIFSFINISNLDEMRTGE